MLELGAQTGPGIDGVIARAALDQRQIGTFHHFRVVRGPCVSARNCARASRRARGATSRLSLPPRAAFPSPSRLSAGSEAMADAEAVWALDFDGVICDSCGESSLAAVRAAKELWPTLFDEVPHEVEDRVVADMRIVRPVVETGYENVLLVRLLLEMLRPNRAGQSSAVSQGLTIGDLLQRWEHDIKPRAMKEWGVEKDPLVHLFGDVRDRWIAQDLPSWIAANALYPGTAEALRLSPGEVYIVTTKQTRFVQLILQDMAGISFPVERIFGLGTGPKVEVLQQIQALPHHQGSTFHFVEDRLATLRNVIKTPALDQWNLYLGVWGYNTEEERKAAGEIPRISVVDLDTFCQKLK